MATKQNNSWQNINLVKNHPLIITAKFCSNRLTGYMEKMHSNHFPILSLWGLSTAMATKPKSKLSKFQLFWINLLQGTFGCLGTQTKRQTNIFFHLFWVFPIQATFYQIRVRLLQRLWRSCYFKASTDRQKTVIKNDHYNSSWAYFGDSSMMTSDATKISDYYFTCVVQIAAFGGKMPYSFK